MDRFIAFFKAHPLWIIGGVVAVIVFWYIASRGSSEAPAYGVMRTGPTDAQVAGTTAENIARIQANAVTVQGQNAIELAKVDSVNVLAALSTSKQISEVQADRDVNLATIVGKTQTDLLNIQADTTEVVAGLQTNLMRDLAGIDFDKFKYGADIAKAVSESEAAAKIEQAKYGYLANRENIDSQERMQSQKIMEGSNWYYFTNPANMAALWGQPVSNTNITNNGQMAGNGATAGNA